MISNLWKFALLLIPVIGMAGSIGEQVGVDNGLVSQLMLQNWWRPSVARSDTDTVSRIVLFPASGVTNGANGYDLSTNVARVVGSNTRLTNGTEYSLSIWAKPKFPEINGASSSAFLWSDRGNSTTNLDFQLIFDPTTKWTFVAYDAAGNFLRVTNSVFYSNQWQHVAVVVTPTNLSIFVNGITQGRRSITNLVNDNSPTNRFGDISWSGTAEATHFRGAFDEPKLWRRALTDYEVMKDYQAGLHWRP